MDSIGKSKVCAEDNQIVSPVVNPCLAMIISNLSFSFKQTYLKINSIKQMRDRKFNKISTLSKDL